MSNIPKTLFVFPVDPLNWRSAVLTIAAYLIMLRNRHDLCLLLETQRCREELPTALLEEVCRDWGKVFIADRNFKNEVATVLASKNLPRLFNPDGWNYNDPMNAALPIARIADCICNATGRRHAPVPRFRGAG